MSRGWESKHVEGQQQEAESMSEEAPNKPANNIMTDAGYGEGSRWRCSGSAF